MIDFDHSAQSTLSIRVDADGLAFSVFNPLAEKDSTPMCEDWPVDESLPLAANLRRAFEEKEELSRSYRRVNVLVATHRFTLMPLELFEDELSEEVLYFNHPRRPHEEVGYNILHSNNLVVLFGMDRSVSSFLRERHPEVHLYAQVSPLLDLFAKKSHLGNTRKMYVHVRREYMDVFCYEQGHLLLGNSYACTEDENRLYYLLYVWNTLGFDQQRDEVHLCGRVGAGDAWVGELKQFVRQVCVMAPVGGMDFQGIREGG